MYMIPFLRLVVLFMVLCFCAPMSSQDKKWQEMHKVKRKETLFGISKKYGITVDELVKANPEMNHPGYELKKGDYIYIPFPSPKKSPEQSKASTVYHRPVKVGVMLPLHDVDGDGRRMVEYYRGMLMAFGKLKQEGYSIDVKAWNVNIDADINTFLVQNGADKCDVIFGPLYTKQVGPLADFARKNNIKLVIPFSISGDDVDTCPNIFQIYQSPEDLNNDIIQQFSARFKNYHVVVVDCNDRTSTKGVFTSALRSSLEREGRIYNITNVNSSAEMFAKAFSNTQPNVVVLNTGRSPELTAVIKKLDALKAQIPSLAISLFGYTEWLMYAKYNQQKFFEYDTYIPTYFYYNPQINKTRAFQTEYKKWFNSDMMDYIPRFALTGYDHGMYFIKGISKDGANFNGSQENSEALQTRMHFVRSGIAGGYRNKSFMFVHYNPNRTISTINF